MVVKSQSWADWKTYVSEINKHCGKINFQQINSLVILLEIFLFLLEINEFEANLQNLISAYARFGDCWLSFSDIFGRI